MIEPEIESILKARDRSDPGNASLVSGCDLQTQKKRLSTIFLGNWSFFYGFLFGLGSFWLSLWILSAHIRILWI